MKSEGPLAGDQEVLGGEAILPLNRWRSPILLCNMIVARDRALFLKSCFLSVQWTQDRGQPFPLKHRIPNSSTLPGLIKEGESRFMIGRTFDAVVNISVHLIASHTFQTRFLEGLGEAESVTM